MSSPYRLGADPAAHSPEEWLAEAAGYDAQAILDQPDPAGDDELWRLLAAEARAAGGRLTDWVAMNKAGGQAIKERRMLAEGSRRRAAYYREMAELSGIIRATEGLS
jgi:hypothetical protein